MNGIVELQIEGKPVTLQYGVQACMLFQELAIKNALDPMSPENHIKLICDLFYCGLYGYRLRKQMPLPSYDDAMEMFDKLAEQDSFQEDTAMIWQTYGQSKWGSQLVEFGEKAKKKIEELAEDQL